MGQPFMEIGTDDPAVTRAFFSAALGWRFRVPEGGAESQGWFETEGGPVGLHGDDDPALVTYLPVPDIETAAAAIRDAGGAVHGPIADEPGFGRFATCSDPRGVRFGLHQK